MTASAPPVSTDVILRLRGLSPEQAAAVERALKPFAAKLGGILNATDHEVYPDHRVIIRRRKIV